MHPKPKILQTELAEILASDDEWIEIVSLPGFSKLAALFLVAYHRKPVARKSIDTMIDAMTLILSSLCRALIIEQTSFLLL